MKLKQKILPVAFSVLLGVGALGIANAAVPAEPQEMATSMQNEAEHQPLHMDANDTSTPGQGVNNDANNSDNAAATGQDANDDNDDANNDGNDAAPGQEGNDDMNRDDNRANVQNNKEQGTNGTAANEASSHHGQYMTAEQVQQMEQAREHEPGEHRHWNDSNSAHHGAQGNSNGHHYRDCR